MMLKIYLWIMGWSGKINTWAWNKQVDIVRSKQRKEEEDYLKELKKKWHVKKSNKYNYIRTAVNRSRILKQEKEFTR